MNIVDPHVHCRDGNQREKDTIARVSYFAARSGVGAIFDMPNTNPPIISRDQVVRRLALAIDTCMPGVSYGLHVGITSDPEQIREAVRCCDEFSLRRNGRVGVVGLKMFAGKSVGDLAVIREEDQKRVYETLGRCGYEGVLVVHCEKEAEMLPGRWNPQRPWSHSFARPARAEMKSICDQVQFFYDSCFNGRLHIAHISTPETVDYVCNVRSNSVKEMKISCGATPHHLFLNYEMLKEGEPMAREKGLLWKVNPPLRSKEEQRGLLQKLKRGRIDWVETDHANHSLDEKFGRVFDDKEEPIYLSGIPGIASWPDVIRRLKQEGISEERIADLTRNNILKSYNLPPTTIGDCSLNNLDVKDYEYGYKGVI